MRFGFLLGIIISPKILKPLIIDIHRKYVKIFGKSVILIDVEYIIVPIKKEI